MCVGVVGCEWFFVVDGYRLSWLVFVCCSLSCFYCLVLCALLLLMCACCCWLLWSLFVSVVVDCRSSLLFVYGCSGCLLFVVVVFAFFVP